MRTLAAKDAPRDRVSTDGSPARFDSHSDAGATRASRRLPSGARTYDRRRTDSYEVILVFNGTEPRAAQTFLESVTGVQAHRLALNLGFGGGNNYAAARARGESLVFLNDDAAVEPGCLTPCSTPRTRIPMPARSARAFSSSTVRCKRPAESSGPRVDAPARTWRSYGVARVQLPAPGRLYLRQRAARPARRLRNARRIRSALLPRVLRRHRSLSWTTAPARRELLYEPRAVIRHVEAAHTKTARSARSFSAEIKRCSARSGRRCCCSTRRPNPSLPKPSPMRCCAGAAIRRASS